jgi:hypothetical protein
LSLPIIKEYLRHNRISYLEDKISEMTTELNTIKTNDNTLSDESGVPDI